MFKSFKVSKYNRFKIIHHKNELISKKLINHNQKIIMNLSYHKDNLQKIF